MGNIKYKYDIQETDMDGECDVCKKYCKRLSYQVEYRRYDIPSMNRTGWTSHKCKSLFGHRNCLEKVRR